MGIGIYNRDGGLKAVIEPDDSGTQTKELAGDNVLSLSFVLWERIVLDVDDYVDYEGERYWLTERYLPVQKSTVEWSYSIRMYGIEGMLGNLLVLRGLDGDEEAEFTLTAPAREHVELIVRCMNTGTKAGSDWKVGNVTESGNIVIDYRGKYCDEALREIAEKAGAEGWVEGQTVNVCRCEKGEPLELGYSRGLSEIEPGRADNVKFYTRLYPMGSSRNIEPERYGHARLQLPGGKKYVEVNADRYGRVDHYESEAFAGIYPRRTGEVSETRSEVRKGDDGNDFTVYYFKDAGLGFDPNDYLLGGKVMRVSFQEGSELGGLGLEENGSYYFEVNYDSGKKEFEIITIWPEGYGAQLPGESLVPKVGDRYILWNIRMPDEYYTLAEHELAEAVEAYNAEHAIDVGVYKARTDHVWIENAGIRLDIGQRVRLLSEEYFPETGYRESRVTKIVRKVNLPGSMDIEIGDAVGVTARMRMNEDIRDVKRYVEGLGSGTGRIPDIIRTGDKTRPTHNNLLSALRAILTFLDKTKDDRSAGQIASDIAIEVGDFVSGTSGAKFWIDKLLNNQSVGELDRLIVRVKAIFRSLTVIETEALCGELMVTPGGGIKCTDVEAVTAQDGTTVYRCWYLAEQDGVKTYCKHKAGDMSKCQSFNLGEGEHENVENRYYWRKVIAVCNTGAGCRTDDKGNRYGYVDLSTTDCDSGSDIPADGDEIVQLGNDTEADRQTAIIISTVDSDSPSIKLYAGIDSYSLDGKCYMRFGYDHATGEVTVRWGKDGSDHYLEYNQSSGLKICGDISVRSTFGGKSFSDYVNGLVGETTELYRIDLSNEMAPVACDAAGNVTGTMPRCRVRVWQGSEDVTGQCAVTTSGTGVSTYRPTDAPAGQWIFGTSNMTADTATVLVTATPKEGLTLEATMSLYKVKPGPQGDSITILSKSVMYQASESGTTPPTGTWSTAIPLVSQGKYLWCRTVINYSDGSSTTSYSVSRNGTGVTVVSTQIRYAKGNYPTQPDDSAFTLTAPGTLTKGEYLWTRTMVTYSDGASTKSYTVAYIGADGDDAVIYEIIPSVDQVLRDAEGNLTPSTVNCSVYKVEGARRSLSNELSLRYKVLPDDTSWHSLSRSSGVSGHVTVSDTAQSIVFELYSGSTVYDRETVPVLTDASGFSGGENLLKGTNQGTAHWKSTVYGSAGTSGNGAGELTPAMLLTARESLPRGVVATNRVSYPFGKSPQSYVPQSVSYQFEFETDSHFQLLKDKKYMVGFDITIKGTGPVHIFLEAQRKNTTSWVTLTPWVYSGSIDNTAKHIGARLNTLASDLTNVRCIRLSVVATQTNEYVTQGSSQVGRYHVDSIEISNLKIEQGVMQTPWTPAPRDTDYLTQAFRENTTISDGVVMTSRVRVGYTNQSGEWVETGGLNGIAADYSGTVIPAAPILYCGGEMIDAAQSTSGNYATSMIRLDGTAYFANNTVRMDFNGMEIGDNIVLDEDGLHLIDTDTNTEKLLVTNKSIGTLSDIQNSVSIPVSLVSASSGMSFYRSTGTGSATEIQPLAGFYLQSMPDRTIRVNNGNAVSSGGMSLTASVQVRFTLSGWQTDYLLDANISVILQVATGSSGYTNWKTYPLSFTMNGSTAVSNTVQISANLAQGNRYQIIVRCTKNAAPGNAPSVTVYPTITASGNAASSINKNVLGNDGLVSVWGSTVLMAKSGEVTGIVGDASLRVRSWMVEMKYGSTPNNGIRIQSDGIWIYVPQTGVANWKRLDIDKLWGQGLLLP